MARAKSSSTSSQPVSLDLGPVVAKLDRIERLLLLLAAKFGADSNEIAMALGKSASSVRDTFSFKKVAPARVKSDTSGE